MKTQITGRRDINGLDSGGFVDSFSERLRQICIQYNGKKVRNPKQKQSEIDFNFSF